MLTPLTHRERRIMEEAYTCGRIYENMVDQPSPAIEYKRLEESCISAANRKTDNEEAVEHPLTQVKSSAGATASGKLPDLDYHQTIVDTEQNADILKLEL